MKRLITICAALLPLLGVAQTVTKLTATKANDYGLVYSLPITALDITIETEYRQGTPGEFQNYATRYLAINDAIRAPWHEAKVKSVTITPRGQVDTSNRWMMQFKGGQAVSVLLDANNIPLGINIDEAPESVEVELPQPVAKNQSPLDTPEARQAITQEMTQSSSMSKRAELAAARIFELREVRNDLISGQAENMPPDGRSLQLTLNNLSAQEAALTAMFAGVEQTWTEVKTITVVPDSTSMRNHVIARLSLTDGIVAADDLSGEPIYLNVSVMSRGEYPVDEKGAQRAFPKGGVAYNLPGTAMVTIMYDGKEVGSLKVELAQLGVTFGLDPKMFTDKKTPASLVFDPTTGAATVYNQ